MNTTPSIFQFNAVEVRCHVDEQGEPWFLANDVCAILGYTNPRKAIADHCREGGVTKRDMGVVTGKKADGTDAVQQVAQTFINEGNLYRLIIKSRKPEAEAFEKQVMEVILPTIRKTGRYETPTEPSITPAQQRQLQDAIAARFPDGKKRPYAWSRFNNHFQLGSYKQLPTSKTEEALAYIAQMPGGDVVSTDKEAAALEQLKHARFCMYFDNGRMILKEIPQDARLLRDEDLPQLIRDPASAIDHTLLPDIIQAAAGRLKQAG